MSSSRYIQKVYASDESGVGEDSATQSARQRTEVFRAGEAISQGDAVCFDLLQGVIAQMFEVVKKLDSGLLIVPYSVVLLLRTLLSMTLGK